MRTLILIPLAALALTACQKQSSDTSGLSLTNASPEEVAKKAAAAGGAGGAGVSFNPGRWETKVELLDMKMPGMDKMPPGFGDELKKQMQQAHVTSSCLTPEAAHRPAAEMFTGHQAKECTFSNYTMAGGKIDATMVCHEKTGDMTMHMAGTFATDSFTIDQEMTANTPQGPTGSKARVTGKRIGDCTVGDSDK